MLDCRYSDDRGWRIKDYELDENRESVYNAITPVTEEDVENAFYTRILSMAVDGPDVIFEEGEFTDITI